MNEVRVKADYQKALELYYESAEKGNAHSQLQLGKLFFHGQGVEQDLKAALEWLQRSAGQGNAEAQAYLGTMHEKGLGVTNDVQQARVLYAKAAEQGNALGQARLAGLYLAGTGVEANTHEAAALYQKAARQGNDEAQAVLGHLYEKGLGVNRDIRQAAELFRRAAEQGNPFAQMKLGDCYLNGMGIDRNPRKALAWYEKAAVQDRDLESAAKARLRLGAMYCQGNGVEKDLAKGFACYEESARLGNVEAQASLGAMYKDGVGVARDPKKAREWLQKSAKKTKAPASIAMGDLYRDGLLVARNNAEAMKWYKKAADEGDAYAKSELLKLQLEESAQPKAKTRPAPAGKEYVRALIEAANRQPEKKGVTLDKPEAQAKAVETVANAEPPPGGTLKPEPPPTLPKPGTEKIVAEKKTREPAPKKARQEKKTPAPRRAIYLFSALATIVAALAIVYLGSGKKPAEAFASLDLGAMDVTPLPTPDPQWLPAMDLVPPGDLLKKIRAIESAMKRGNKNPKPIVAAAPVITRSEPVPPLLRREYASLDEGEIAKMLAAKNIFDAERNPQGNFPHRYEVKDAAGLRLVIDRATGLAWARQQNPVRMNLKKSLEWIASLNRISYGTITSWRLPTIEEAASLLKKDGGKKFLDAIFGEDLKAVWTGDGFTDAESWVVDFQNGTVAYEKNKSRLATLMVSSDPD